MNTQKGFAPIVALLIVLGVIVVGGIGYSFMKKNEAIENKPAIQEAQLPKEEVQQSKDETVDWNIYRNEKYGFEIKYPDGAFSILEDATNEYLLNMESIDFYDSLGTKFNLAIYIREFPLDGYELHSHQAPVYFGYNSQNGKCFMQRDFFPLLDKKPSPPEYSDPIIEGDMVFCPASTGYNSLYLVPDVKRNRMFVIGHDIGAEDFFSLDYNSINTSYNGYELDVSYIARTFKFIQ